MKLYFVTKNKHKVGEAEAALSGYGIEIEQLAEEKVERKDMKLEEVARYNAENFYERYKKPVIVDDTGVFFEAYPDFPGNHPKLMFDLLGYKGLLKLVGGESRKGLFRTVVAYCDGKTTIFTGEMRCILDTKVHDPEKDVLPYERIFLYEGKPLSDFSRQEKNAVSHRAKAFRKLAEFLRQKDPQNR